MLAYVFWHWPQMDVPVRTYQKDLLNYHQTLSAHRPEGFHSTRVLWMEQAPWLERDAQTYEDWHVVANSAALDPLNEQAVSGPCQEPHRLIARWTQGGAGALYHLVFGDAHLSSVRLVYRFNKPAGMTYEVLYRLLRPVVQERRCALWTRYMCLGPGPEFCLHSSDALVFPDGLSLLTIPVQQIYLSSGQ